MLLLFPSHCRTAPAFATAGCVFWGVLCSWLGWGIGATVLAAVPVGGLAHTNGRQRIILTLSALLLAGGGYHRHQHANAMSSRHSYIRLLPRQTARVTLRLRIIRAPVQLTALPPSRERAEAEIIALGSNQNPTLQTCRGRILLRLSPQRQPPAPDFLQPDEIWECAGVLEPAPRPDSTWRYYGNYLRAQGIYHTFSPWQWELLAEPDRGDFRYRLHRWRTRLGETLVAGMRSPESARLILALGLGLTEYFPPELSRLYISTGTIHIFAISGLHIGIIALLLEKFLRLLPLTPLLRHLLTASLLVLYLLLTGVSPSAVRATGMALLILYAICRRRPPASLNALGVMLLGTLLYHPEALQHSSLQYSYLVVFALLCGYPGLQAIMHVIRERELWIPRRLGRPPALRRAGYGLLQLSGTAMLAWVASAGISMKLNGRLCLLSPLVNLPLGATVTLLLTLVPIKIVLGLLWPPTQPALGILLEIPLVLMRLCGEYPGAETFQLPTGEPASPILILYHLLLLLHLLALRRLNEPPAADPTPEDSLPPTPK